MTALSLLFLALVTLLLATVLLFRPEVDPRDGVETVSDAFPPAPR